MLFVFSSYAQKTEHDYLKIIEQAKEEKDVIKATLELIDYNISHSKTVKKYLQDIKIMAHKNNDNLLLGDYYFHKSRISFSTSAYDSCIVYAHKASTLFKSLNKTNKEALANNKLGATYQILLKNKLALIHLNNAAPHLRDKQLINNYIAKGNVYIQQYEIEKGIKYYTKAYDESVALNHTEFLFNIYNGMAAAHDKNKDLKKSIDYLQKALADAIKSNNIYFQIVCYQNIGHQYRKYGDDKKAIVYFEKGLSLKDKIENKLVLAMLNLNYSESLVNLNKLKEAKFFINKADSIYNIINNTERRTYVLNIKAAIAKKENRYNDAINLLNQSLSLSKKNEITGIISNNYFSLSEAYEANGEISKALTAYKKYETIKDSIAQRKKVKEIETLNIKFDISQYEQELVVKDNEVAILEAKKKSSNYRNLLLVVITLCLLLFIYWQRKMNKSKRNELEKDKEIISLKKEYLENKMTFKDNRITEYAIHINQRNEFLESCKSQLKSIKKSTVNKDTKDKVVQLQYYIKNHIEVQKEEVEFNTESNEKTKDFKFKLEQKFPNLTNKEILVCTYLLLNLSSKKIAEKMNISFLSVNNYRTSIRRKNEFEKG